MPIVRAMMMSTPTNDRRTRPSPPLNAVPPRSTTRIADSSMPSPESGSPSDMKLERAMPASAAVMPTRM